MKFRWPGTGVVVMMSAMLKTAMFEMVRGLLSWLVAEWAWLGGGKGGVTVA